jgi:hypothetical protein
VFQFGMAGGPGSSPVDVEGRHFLKILARLSKRPPRLAQDQRSLLGTYPTIPLSGLDVGLPVPYTQRPELRVIVIERTDSDNTERWRRAFTLLVEAGGAASDLTGEGY